MTEQTLAERLQKQITEWREKRQQLVEAANMQISEMNGRIAALTDLLEEELKEANEPAERGADAKKDED